MNSQQHRFGNGWAIATTIGLFALSYGPEARATSPATPYRIDRLLSTKATADQTTTDFSSFTNPSLASDGTIAFVAALKGTNITMSEPPPLASGRERQYIVGVYKRLPNGQITTVKTQENLERYRNYGSGAFDETKNICTFLPPSLSGRNVAFTVKCEYYSNASYGTPSPISRSATLSAEINGQFIEVIAQSGTRNYFYASPSVPSIAGSKVVFEIQNSIALYAPEGGTILGNGQAPKITENGNVLFLSFPSLALRRNGVVAPVKTPYNQPSPDGFGKLTGNCGYEIYQSQVVYCMQSDTPNASGYAYSAIYQQQGDNAFRMIDNTTRWQPGNRQFGAFSNISTSGQAIAFVETARTTNRRSLFLREGNGALTQLVTEQGRLEGKEVAGFSVGSRSIQGKSVVFSVKFVDGTEAIYRARPI